MHHDPLRGDEAREFHAAGGRAQAEERRKRIAELRARRPEGMPARMPKSLEDAVRWSAWAMWAAALSIIDARTAHEIGYLVNAFKAAVEKRDLQREIDELHAQLAQAQEAMRRPKAVS